MSFSLSGRNLGRQCLTWSSSWISFRATASCLWSLVPCYFQILFFLTCNKSIACLLYLFSNQNGSSGSLGWTDSGEVTPQGSFLHFVFGFWRFHNFWPSQQLTEHGGHDILFSFGGHFTGGDLGSNQQACPPFILVIDPEYPDHGMDRRRRLRPS